MKLEALFLLTTTLSSCNKSDRTIKESAVLKAITTIQKYIRGTLARWNHSLAVMRLERKRDAILSLKQKQLKKLKQRQEQKKLAFRVQMEHEHDHRAKMRHLRRAQVLIQLIKGQTKREEETEFKVYQQIQELKDLNERAEASIESLKTKTQNLKTQVTSLETTQEELRHRCNEYKFAIQLLQEALSASL